LIYEDGVLREFDYPDTGSDISFLIRKTEEGDYQSALFTPDMAKSLFVRLYYLSGYGLTISSLFWK